MAKSNITIPQLGAVLAAVSMSGTTARSAALTTGIVRLTPSADCFVKFGSSSVTAATTDHFLVGGMPYDFEYGTSTNVAVITSGGTGTLYISELV